MEMKYVLTIPSAPAAIVLATYMKSLPVKAR